MSGTAAGRAYARLAELVNDPRPAYAHGAGDACRALVDCARRSDWEAMRHGPAGLDDRPADYQAGAVAAAGVLLDLIDAVQAADPASDRAACGAR
ncbi:hypothetical protein CcI49_06810 [Frankia sp. CcI49]|uniref:hypothetical protein n=1 Tax=Frankia sp. CcI49 TaxID=1745382 RepID=UPI0009776938|nr:hypothetical protein [Frankia sp. CcI49]ONH61294.1 hypothetical protein CcI49_06810 [Frankia sp. CcI49]